MADTNINAYKEELAQAEIALDQAKSKVESLKAYIKSVEGEPAPEVVEAVETDVVVAKSLSKQNRDELNATAEDWGIEDPESYETKADLVEAIEAKQAAEEEDK